MRNLILLILLGVALVGVAGCKRDRPTASHPAAIRPFDPDTCVKVTIMADGTMFADGEAVTFEQLSAKLGDLRNKHGTVWYYREAAEKEAPPIALKVMRMVSDNELSITMSTKPDFSDEVGPDGTIYPRTESGIQQTPETNHAQKE